MLKLKLARRHDLISGVGREVPFRGRPFICLPKVSDRRVEANPRGQAERGRGLGVLPGGSLS